MSHAETRPAGDARTAPVAVWQILEKLKGDDLKAWRTAPIENRPSAEQRNLDINGFPFGWYPIMLSTDLVVGEVKPLRYFATDLAIWRGEDGQVRMLDAYCKHLGSHMGYGGKVHGNLLECPFHAWRYDGSEGTVKEIPYSKSIPPQVKRKCTRNWHMTEANRWIWMWYHPQDVAPLWDVVHLPETTDPEWTDYDITEWRVYGSLQNMAENGVDVAHFKYIHGTANVPLGDLHWEHFTRGAEVRAKMGTPWGEVDGCIAYENNGPGQSWTRFTGISETLLIASTVPVELDELHVRFCFTQPRSQAEGERAGVARALIRDIVKQFDQDKVIWDRQKYEPNAYICEGDGPIAQFRKWYAKFYAGPEGDAPELAAAE